MNTKEEVLDTNEDSGGGSAPEPRSGEAQEHSAPPKEPHEDPLATLEMDLAKAKKEAADNWERCLRTAAELDNVRKRAARDVEHANRFALERFAKEVLSVRDALEMAIGATADVEAMTAHVEGTRMTLKTLDQVLEKYGVTPIDPQGQPFDPEFHEAMATRAEEGTEPGTVLEVVQKGFALNGRLLRAARVLVAA